MVIDRLLGCDASVVTCTMDFPRTAEYGPTKRGHNAADVRAGPRQTLCRPASGMSSPVVTSLGSYEPFLID